MEADESLTGVEVSELLGVTREVALEALGEGTLAVAEERRRQISKEGFSPSRDRELFSAELARASQAYVAAAVYAQATGRALELAPDSWPWDGELFKPSKDPSRNLVKAGALIAAELDRLAAGGGGGGPPPHRPRVTRAGRPCPAGARRPWGSPRG